MTAIVFAGGGAIPPINSEGEDRLRMRALRASPPGRAAKGERRKVFASALEQSEQLLAAAAAAPPVVRPLLLFYGLSQGIRAVLAADNSLDNNSYQTRGGHGVSTQNLDAELKDIELNPHESGMLPQLCRSMAVDMFVETFKFGNLWAATPDLFEMRLTSLTSEPAVGSLTWARDTFIAEKTVVNIGFQPKTNVEHLTSRTEIADYINRFFQLPLQVEPLPEASLHQSSRITDKFVTLSGHVDAPRDVVSRQFESRVSVGYNPWVAPAIGGATPRPDPLVFWWCLLEALSARARYSPQRWTSDIDPDTSPVAVQLEILLAEAEPRCYRLILDAVRAVSR